jgi:hypothetical protein
MIKRGTFASCYFDKKKYSESVRSVLTVIEAQKLLMQETARFS